MEIQIVSDLHREFVAPAAPLGFEPTAETLIIAGDICVGLRPLEFTLGRLSKLWENVIIVLGNHDFYGWRIGDLKINTPDNVYLLWNSAITLGSQRFVGTTLWFAKNPLAKMYETQLADFSQIVKSDEIYDHNLLATNYLSDTVQKDDIVITHHLPSYKSVAPEFTNSVFNSFFVCDVEPLFNRKPKLWIHGHTHAEIDYQLNETRVICNPMGYLHSPNYRFNPGLTVSF